MIKWLVTRLMLVGVAAALVAFALDVEPSFGPLTVCTALGGGLVLAAEYLSGGLE